MNSKEYSRFKKQLKHSKEIHEKFKNGSFINDKILMAELMDDSKINTNGCYKKKPKIGKQYQVDMIGLGLDKKKYNLRN